jgi:hypothetical protein
MKRGRDLAAGGCRVNTGCTGFVGPAGVYSSGAVRAGDVCRFRDKISLTDMLLECLRAADYLIDN